MSIVRIGLSETKNFAEGYEAIFGKKTTGQAKKPRATKRATARKKGKQKK